MNTKEDWKNKKRRQRIEQGENLIRLLKLGIKAELECHECQCGDKIEGKTMCDECQKEHFN